MDGSTLRVSRSVPPAATPAWPHGPGPGRGRRRPGRRRRGGSWCGCGWRPPPRPGRTSRSATGPSGLSEEGGRGEPGAGVARREAGRPRRAQGVGVVARRGPAGPGEQGLDQPVDQGGLDAEADQQADGGIGVPLRAQASKRAHQVPQEAEVAQARRPCRRRGRRWGCPVGGRRPRRRRRPAPPRDRRGSPRDGDWPQVDRRRLEGGRRRRVPTGRVGVAAEGRAVGLEGAPVAQLGGSGPEVLALTGPLDGRPDRRQLAA